MGLCCSVVVILFCFCCGLFLVVCCCWLLVGGCCCFVVLLLLFLFCRYCGCFVFIDVVLFVISVLVVLFSLFCYCCFVVVVVVVVVSLPVKKNSRNKDIKQQNPLFRYLFCPLSQPKTTKTTKGLFWSCFASLPCCVFHLFIFFLLSLPDLVSFLFFCSSFFISFHSVFGALLPGKVLPRERPTTQNNKNNRRSVFVLVLFLFLVGLLSWNYMIYLVLGGGINFLFCLSCCYPYVRIFLVLLLFFGCCCCGGGGRCGLFLVVRCCYLVVGVVVIIVVIVVVLLLLLLFCDLFSFHFLFWLFCSGCFVLLVFFLFLLLFVVLVVCCLKNTPTNTNKSTKYQENPCLMVVF